MPEQRNPYLGVPPRSWIMVRLEGKAGNAQELKVIADTGSPFMLVIDSTIGLQLSHGEGPEVDTNFGPLAGAWFKLAMSELGLTRKVLGYYSNQVAASTQVSHEEFQGLAGLPLLRLLEYGGDAEHFWIRSRNQPPRFRSRRRPSKKG